MKIKVDKSFERDADKIRDPKLLLKLSACIEQVINGGSRREIQNLKKLKGFKNHYRLIVGDYRAGIGIQNEEVIFERFLHI